MVNKTPYKIAGIFPVPIIQIKFGQHHKYTFSSIEQENRKPKGWRIPLNTSFPNIEKDDNFISMETANELKSDIKESIDSVFKELNITTKYLINEFWYNVYHKNQGQEVHTHLGPINPYWCGIYYNKNSTPTGFVKESGIHAVHNVPDWRDSKLNLFFLNNIEMSAEDGNIILFPPYLKHYVPPQRKIDSDDKMRLTFSFNLYQITTMKHYAKNLEVNNE